MQAFTQPIGDGVPGDFIPIFILKYDIDPRWDNVMVYLWFELYCAVGKLVLQRSGLDIGQCSNI